MTFDTEVTSDAAILEHATLRAEQVAATDNFYATRKVALKKLKYQAIDDGVLAADALADVGILSASAASRPSIDVLSVLSADIEVGTRQELFRLERTEPASGSAFADFSCGGFALDVVFLRP